MALELDTLPARPVARLTRPFVRFMALEASAGAVLLAATAVALVLANTGAADWYRSLWERRLTVGFAGAELSYPLWYWINDGLMTVFFFVIGLEIKRELIWGELRDRRNVVLPAVAACGGVAVPIAIYLLLQPAMPARAGWAVPMATDIAFVVGCLAVLGARVPPGLKVFLLSLAIVDDLLAVVVIAVVFSAGIDAGWLAAAAGGLMVVVALDALRVRRIAVYALAGGIVWLCTLKSGVHPTVAGVLLGLLTPARAWLRDDTLLEAMDRAVDVVRDGGDARGAERREVAEALAFAATESVSPLERLERGLHPWVAFAIMPVFALANAGVAFSADSLGEPVALAVALALTLGKPLGIAGASLLAVRLGVARLPDGVSRGALAGAAWLGGIGFTMALFLASLSLEGRLLEAAKAGILMGSAVSLVGGLVVLGRALRPAAAEAEADGAA